MVVGVGRVGVGFCVWVCVRACVATTVIAVPFDFDTLREDDELILTLTCVSYLFCGRD